MTGVRITEMLLRHAGPQQILTHRSKGLLRHRVITQRREVPVLPGVILHLLHAAIILPKAIPRHQEVIVVILPHHQEVAGETKY